MENRIKDILSEKGLTAKELSSVIGLSSVSLYNITKLYMTKSVAYFFKARNTTMELLL